MKECPFKSTMIWPSELLTRYYSGEQIKKNVRSTYGGEESYVKGLGAETRGKDTTWNKQV